MAYERWLIARGNVLAPNWETLIALVKKMREEKWLVGPGRAFTTVEVGEANEEPVPETIDRAWIDDESREELRMVWSCAGAQAPLAGAEAKTIELQRAPDFVYPVRKEIGPLPTECRCKEDLSFEWDEEELTPTFTKSTGIYTECEACSRTFDPAKGTAKLSDPVTKKTEDVNGGAAYRFAIKVVSEEAAAFAPAFLAFVEKEFGRSFYEVGAAS
ncbi:MAG: hypothetical protein KIT84_01315 [Labilithrix sp.]|nr:hypothetical protein [Labilithrix sp.]MCW5809625.1 hypothetical protein [Labilithrix sp.]